MSLSHKMTASSSSLSCKSMSVAVVFRLPFSVFWNISLSLLSSL